MSQFKTYSIVNKSLFDIYVKYVNVFYYTFWIIYFIGLISINHIAVRFIDNIYISIFSVLIFILILLYIRRKQKKILKTITSDGNITIFKKQILVSNDSGDEILETQDIKKIRLLKRLLRNLDDKRFKYNLISIETNTGKEFELLTDAYSSDKNIFTLIKTLNIFSKINNVSFENHK